MLINITSMIVNSITKQYKRNLQITYFVDKIRILETIWVQCDWSEEAVVNFWALLHNLLEQPLHINIIWNSYNPLRLIIILIKLMRNLDDAVFSLGGELKALEEDLVNMAIVIINQIDSLSDLRIWLYEEIDEELKVIDYLALLDLIRVLNLPKIAKISLSIWAGTYDWGASKSTVNSVKTSRLAEAYRTLDVNFDEFLTIIGRK